MEVYVDLLFGLNLVMNYAVLWAAGRLSGQDSTAGRLLAGAALGAAYSLAVLFPVPPFVTSLGARGLCLLAMVGISYRPSRATDWFKLAGASCLAAVAAGGAALAVDGLMPTMPTPVVLLGASGLACIALGRRAVGLVRDRGWEWVVRAEVEIVIGSRRTIIPGLIDTGNRLRDPLADCPVVVVDHAVLGRLLPSGAVNWGLRGEVSPDVSPAWLRRLRAIPYRTLDRQGVMYGVRVDRVTVIDHRHRLSTDRAVVGASPGPISPDGRVRALVPPELVWRSRPAARTEPALRWGR